MRRRRTPHRLTSGSQCIQIGILRKERRDGPPTCPVAPMTSTLGLLLIALDSYRADSATGWATDSAARAMIFATSSGLDMKGAWLEATDRTVAFILFAMNSCAGGGII